MKVVVTGASGLLGRAIMKHLQREATWSVTGLAFSRVGSGLRKCDLRNENEVRQMIHDIKPDVLIHAAAERRPDVVSKSESESELLNIAATEYLAKHLNTVHGFMLYISTDYVFDGKNPPYKVTDRAKPINKYGEMKLAGEEATLKHCKNSGVLRVPILYGEVEYIEESAVTVLLNILRNVEKPTCISNYERRFPTFTNDIAVVCSEIIKHRQNTADFNGIWHWRGVDKLTKYSMIEIMAKVFNLSMAHISPDNQPTKGAARPFDCELDCSVLEAIGITQRTSFEVGIRECLSPFIKF